MGRGFALLCFGFFGDLGCFFFVFIAEDAGINSLTLQIPFNKCDLGNFCNNFPTKSERYQAKHMVPKGEEERKSRFLDVPIGK